MQLYIQSFKAAEPAKDVILGKVRNFSQGAKTLLFFGPLKKRKDKQVTGIYIHSIHIHTSLSGVDAYIREPSCVLFHGGCVQQQQLRRLVVGKAAAGEKRLVLLPKTRSWRPKGSAFRCVEFQKKSRLGIRFLWGLVEFKGKPSQKGKQGTTGQLSGVKFKR